MPETMTREEIEKIEKAIEKWRKDHPDVESLREAYRKSIPQQVWASMAFEGEHVSLEMLEEYMKSLESKKKEADTSSGRQKQEIEIVEGKG